MSTVIIRHRLPSKLFLDKVMFDNGDAEYLLVSGGMGGLWDRGRAYAITQDEYDALLPLAERVA